MNQRTAVITGAASGIGLALARKCASEGMNVVMADIDSASLSRACKQIRALGGTAIAARTDVSKLKSVQHLANRAVEEFGAVHLLFNNAGVGGTSILSATEADWQWTLGANLWGVIHGIQVFLPILQRQTKECHIVNTASVAGLLTTPGLGTYHVSKHAVVALSECLFRELRMVDSKVGVSVLCPGWVKTNILTSRRERLISQSEPNDTASNEPRAKFLATMKAAIDNGMEPEKVADITFEAIREKRFYVLTHPEYIPAIGVRMQDIVKGRNPTELPAG